MLLLSQVLIYRNRQQLSLHKIFCEANFLAEHHYWGRSSDLQ